MMKLLWEATIRVLKFVGGVIGAFIAVGVIIGGAFWSINWLVGQMSEWAAIAVIFGVFVLIVIGLEYLYLLEGKRLDNMTWQESEMKGLYHKDTPLEYRYGQTTQAEEMKRFRKEWEQLNHEDDKIVPFPKKEEE
jgi:uncharacterized membrane protein